MQWSQDFAVDRGLVGDTASVTITIVEVLASIFAKNPESAIFRQATGDDLTSECALEPVRLPGKNRHAGTSRPVVVEDSVESCSESFRAGKPRKR